MPINCRKTPNLTSSWACCTGSLSDGPALRLNIDRNANRPVFPA